MKVSGKTMKLAPFIEASSMASSTNSVVAARLLKLGAICTAAALIIAEYGVVGISKALALVTQAVNQTVQVSTMNALSRA